MSSRSLTCPTCSRKTQSTLSRSTPPPPTFSIFSRSKANTNTSLVCTKKESNLRISQLDPRLIKEYPAVTAFPWTAGVEFSGVVVAVPKDPETKPLYPVGTRVFGASQGAYAEYVHAAEQTILPVPEGWSFQDAAGLFVTAPTSYSGLVQRANIKKGDWVLVHAAAGGVGLAAVQSEFL